MSAMSRRHQLSVETAQAKVEHYEDLLEKWRLGTQAARHYDTPLPEEMEHEIAVRITICIEAWQHYLREVLAVGITVDLE